MALAGGPGQICWSLLSGRKQVAQSLGAQAFGIVSGTAAAAWFIAHGDFVKAALAFAGGPLVATIVGLPFIARLRLQWKARTSGVRRQLRYSAAMAATIGFSTLVLFSLRWFYRDRFGPTQLGYWIAANRISDMSTQLLALFLLQLFVPQLARVNDDAKRARLLIRYGAGGAALTGTALAVFLLAGRPLVQLFRSDAYLPAIPAIRLYMLGDFLRVWVSLAMFTSFASGRPGRYAAIEMSTLSVMAVLTIALSAAGEVRAPQIAYAAAYGAMALTLGIALMLRSREGSRSSSILSSHA